MPLIQNISDLTKCIIIFRTLHPSGVVFFTHVLQSAHRYTKLQSLVQNASKSAHYHPLDPLPLLFGQNAQ